MVDDARIVARSVRRPDEFATLFERHFGTVFAFCARRVGRDVAEDLAGETFRRAFEARASFDARHRSALPWLIGISLNLVRHEFRTRDRERRAVARAAVAEAVRSPSFESTLVESHSNTTMLQAIVEKLPDLPDDEREPLLLYAWDELSYEQIAAIVDVPIGTVRSRIHRARAHLGSLLDGTTEPLPLSSAQRSQRWNS